MLRGAVLSAILLVALPALAGPQQRSIQTQDGLLIMPANAAVRPVHLPTKADDYFAFTGPFVVSGTYWYGYRPVPGHPNYIDLFLDLDHSSIDALPRLKFEDGSRMFVEQIRITNQRAFVKAVVPPDVLGRIKKKQLTFTTAHVTLMVDRLYFVSDCGYLWTSARFVAVQKEPPNMPTKDANYGC